MVDAASMLKTLGVDSTEYGAIRVMLRMEALCRLLGDPSTGSVKDPTTKKEIGPVIPLSGLDCATMWIWTS